MQKPLQIKNECVSLDTYDQKPTCYTDDILYKTLHEQHPDVLSAEGLTIDIKRFKDVQVGDTLYSVNVDKLIEYKVLDITKQQVNVKLYEESYDYNRMYGMKTIVTYTYKSLKGGKTMQFHLFEEEACAKNYTGFDRWSFGYDPKVGEQLFPNTLETGTINKIFSCKEGARFYLQELYESRMLNANEFRKKMNLELAYANEYVPVLEKLGWKPKELN